MFSNNKTNRVHGNLTTEVRAVFFVWHKKRMECEMGKNKKHHDIHLLNHCISSYYKHQVAYS